MGVMNTDQFQCSRYKCRQCGACCQHSPGWFAPDEVESAARYLSLSVENFAKTYLIIDSIEIPSYGKIEVFAPLRLNRFNAPALPPLSRADYLYRFFEGPCIFYQNDNCLIYPYRPLECKNYYCAEIAGSADDIGLTHEAIALLWYNSALNR